MKKYILIALILVIQSCSGNIKSDWSCPVLKGGKGNCVSIREADFSLKSEVPKSDFDYSKSKQKIKINLIAPKISHLKKLIKEGEFVVKKHESAVGKLRTKEKIGRVWFAPYIDSNGYQHSSSIVYVVDEEAKWIMR